MGGEKQLDDGWLDDGRVADVDEMRIETLIDGSE